MKAGISELFEDIEHYKQCVESLGLMGEDWSSTNWGILRKIDTCILVRVATALSPLTRGLVELQQELLGEISNRVAADDAPIAK